MASASPSMLSSASVLHAENGRWRGSRATPSGDDAFGAVSRSWRVSSERADRRLRDARSGIVRSPRRASAANGALLIIDPQRSFTGGVWMQSVGAGAETEVAPIRLAFDHCARLLAELDRRVETMFTRCPFPPDSYAWDERLGEVVDDSQLYFVKPGNSVLWPPTNGFSKWADHLVQRGRNVGHGRLYAEQLPACFGAGNPTLLCRPRPSGRR